jgi:VWFA-related protein
MRKLRQTRIFAPGVFLCLLALCLLAAPALRAQSDLPKASNAPTDDGNSMPDLPDPKTPATHPAPSSAAAVPTPAPPEPKFSGQPSAPGIDGMVSMYFSVRDHHHDLITGLKKKDFQITEDGVPQQIEDFDSAYDRPITLGVLMDTSASQSRLLPAEREAGMLFLAHTLTMRDLAFVINFDVTVSLLQDCTNDMPRLRRAFDRANLNDGGGSGGRGTAGAGQGTIPVHKSHGTLLYDAVYLAVAEKLQKEIGRRAIVLLTDGDDHGSQKSLAKVIEAAQRADAAVYVILLADHAPDEHPHFHDAESQMRKLVEQTGGRLFDVGDSAKKLRASLEQLSHELHDQYVLTYLPRRNLADGKFHHVEIKANDSDYRVLSRRGYWAPRDASAPAAESPAPTH